MISALYVHILILEIFTKTVVREVGPQYVELLDGQTSAVRKHIHMVPVIGR